MTDAPLRKLETPKPKRCDLANWAKVIPYSRLKARRTAEAL
jgi:hypothetical protein